MPVRMSMAVLLTLGVLLLLMVACSLNPSPTLTPIPTLAPGSAPAPPDPALGVDVYEKNCTGCHGVRAEGTDSPALRNNRFITSGDQAVYQMIADGLPGTEMPAWLQANGGPLDSEEIYDLIAYLKALQGVVPLPTATPQPPEPTETPRPANAATPAPAEPSQPGGPGPAATLAGSANSGKLLFGKYCAECHGPQGRLGRPNPGSDDGTAPTLSPIDPTISNKDPKVFAANIDLFLEHGSIPAGPNPEMRMPDFGDRKLLQPQQLADIIAYIISLNSQ
jgi:mono/diheme cytochrome c family protein